MNPHLPQVRRWSRQMTHVIIVLAAFSILSMTTAANVFAQKSFSRTYPARGNIHVELKNLFGTITVEAWGRNDIKVYATMESPAAHIVPEFRGDGLLIDVVRDNRGRDDVGDVNFTISVPVNSSVDLMTKRGQITVRGVQGAQVYARVTTEGDIELTGIRATNVMAENTMGNILFDAELLQGGTYVLKSMQGDINLRLNASSGFNLTATAPRTRNINLGGFQGRGVFEYLSNNRKVVGRVGNGGASLTTTNQLGSIVFSLR